MTIGNMRANGAPTPAVHCLSCHRQALLDVERYADAIAVPSLGLRMVCKSCGAIGADARPNWNEMAPASLFGAPSGRR